ncbi:Cyclic di-GMP phosphodiesterase response regulator RpfG [compost metagenome]
MRLMPIGMCRPGMRLGKKIYSAEGAVLLAENVELTQRLLDRLYDYGIDYLHISDPRTDDILIRDMINEETRVRAVKEIRNTFRKLMETSNKRGSVQYYDLGRQFRDLMNTIIDDLSDHNDAMTMLTNMNVVDNYLFQHSLNVCIYATMLGLSNGLNRDELTTMGLGALLHDIGKTRISLEILRKASPLSNEEYDEMKKHTEQGFQILKDEPNLPLIVAHCAFQHHERINGSGYPRGIQGNEIHNYARWIGVIDSYDAMTTQRVYRGPMLPHQAMEQLFIGSNTLYDQDKIASFRDKIAIYPLGMPVTLNTGEVGVVSNLKKSIPHRPVIRILQSESGEDLKEPYEVDLSTKLTVFITAIGETKIDNWEPQTGIELLD